MTLSERCECDLELVVGQGPQQEFVRLLNAMERQVSEGLVITSSSTTTPPTSARISASTDASSGQAVILRMRPMSSQNAIDMFKRFQAMPFRKAAW